MDLSKLSTADLEAFAAGDLAKVSTAGLERLLAPPVDPSKSGFIPAAKAGWENLKGDVAGLAGRTGIMGLPAAEKYQAERKADAAKAFSATQDDWSESPWLKFKETLGGSLPYMAAPVIAGGATAAAVGSAPVGLAALAPLAAAGLASGAQFTATNIGRQQEEGVRLQDTNLTNAMLAAAPQAALDMVGLGKIPGVRQLIGLVSKDIGKEAAVKIAGQSLQKIVADYAKATGTAMGAEGITEAGQQVFERMQAGLNLTDEKARKEYWDNFVGGAVLGGALAPAGRYSERGKEAGAQAVAADKLAADEALKTRTAKTAQDALDAADPVKAKETIAAFEALAQQRIALQQQIKKKLDPNSPTYAVDAAANKELQTQIAALKAQEKELVPGYRQAVKTAIDPNDFAMQQALAGEGIQPHGLKARSLYPEEHYAAPAAPETTPSALKYMTDRVEAAQANSPLPPSPLKLVQYLMQSVPMAKQVVALRQPIPGIPKQQSDLVLSSLVLHIKDAEKNARKENAAELEARTQDLKSTLPAEPEAPADTFTQDTEQRRQDIQDAQEAAAAQAEAQAQQDRAAALLSAQSAPAGGVPPVQGESELRSLVHRGAGMSTRSMEGRTIEDAQRDLDLARSRRDKAGIDAAIEEMRDFREKEKQAEAVPMGYITSQWRGDQPPDVAAHQDALIARRQGLTQLLMAKPGAREAAQGNLRSRIVTEIEAARGTQTTKAERQQIAALADPVIAKLLSLKKPTMTAAREAQAALDAIRNKFTVKNVYLPPTEPMGPREARGTELLREREAGTPNADLLALAPRRTFKPEAAPESDAPIVAKDDTQTAALQKEQQRIAEQLAAHDALIGKSGMTAAEERALSAGDISTTKGYSADDVAAAIARNNTERMDLQGRIDALTARANQATDPAEKADVQESLDQARADMPLLEAAQSLLIERTRALRRQGVMPAETPGLRTPEELKALQTRKQEIATQLSEAAAKKAAAEQAAQTAQRVAAGKEAIAAKNAATEKDVLAGKLQAGREELAALPGMSVTHEAAEKAARLIETGPAKIEHLRAKIADPEATKTTRDHDKHELKVLLEVLQLAHDVAVGKEGAMDAIEARIVDISDKIAAYQEQIDAGQPRKYRMDKIAELKRERAALRKSEKGTFNPPTKTPIVGTSRTRTLPEQLAAATDKYAAVQANPAAKAGDKKALENRVKQLQKEVTAAEDQRATDFLEKALALEQMGTTGKLPKGRISQASRSEITPGDTRTGTPESMGQVQRENALTGATDTITPKTGTRNPVTEERKVVETNRAVGKPEQEAANVIADQLGVSTPTKEKTPVAQLEELISIKQKLLAEKIDAKTVAEKRAAEQLRKNDENKLLTDEQRKEAAEEIEKRPVRIEKEIQRLETELDRLAEEVAPLRDAEVAAAEMAKFKAGEAKATPQASVEDAKAAVAESTKKKQPKNTKKKGLSETAEETAGAVEDVYADYDNVADDTFARSDDPFFSRGKTKDAHTADSLVEELKPSFGGQDVRKRIGVYDTVAAMLKAHPEYEGRIPADAKGFVDGTHAFLIAENIGKGEGLSVTVHEIGAHIGMRNLFGPALYKALVNATKNWAAKADGSLEAKIARAAKERVEAAGTAKHKYDDELLAHTIEEAMKAGVSPTKLSGKGPIGQFIGRIMQAMQKILQRYGIAPNSLNMQHLVDMAYGAAGKELGSNGPRHGGAKLFTYAGEVEARDTGFRKDLTAEQRKETRPYLSQDVYKEELLFSRGNAAATTNPLLKPLANEPPPDKRGFFRKTFDGMGHKIAAGAFDMKDPVLRAMHAQATASGDWHSFYQAAHDMRKADMVVNIMKSILSYGAPELRKDAKGYHIFSAAKGVSGVDLFKLAEKVPGADGTEKFKQITRYMTALQGARLGAERVGMTKEEVRDILAHVAATPALKNSLEAFRDAYHEYNTKLVNAVRDTGEISAEKAREMLRHRDYAPKYRQHKGQIEMSVGDNRWESIGDIATTPFMHAFKGGEEAIMPINESIMYNTNLLVSMATTNMAKRNIAHVLMQAGLPAKKMFIRDGKAPTGKEYLSWKEHGAPKYLKIDTEGTSMDGVSPVMLAESIEGFHGTMPALVKASAKLGDLLRAGVTRSPMYTLRQLLKDPVGAASTSGVDANPLTAIARTAKQYAAAFTGGNAELEAVNRNALVQSNILTGDRDDMVKAATEYANGGSQSAYRKIMNFLDTGAANADAATRAMIYKDSTSRGLSELEASYRVMESMNFHKRGAWSSVQYLNRMIPFFNAGLQGLNVTYRAMRGDMPFNEKLQVKQRFVNNALLLAAGALAYAAIMDDDPEYKKLKASDKYGALHFRVPGSDALFKLPVGFQEVGLPWAVGQALFDTFADNSEDKQIVKALFKYAMGAVPGVSSAGVPQGLKQVLETATNTDFFSWNPIVPPRLENELPELQYTGTTPEVLKALGKLGISPIKAQHFLEGLFSRIATDVLHTADIAWESAVGDSGVEKTARTLKDMPFFSSAVQGTTSSAAKEDVYEWANKVKKVNDSFSDIKKKMDAPRIQEFAKEHRFELASAQAAGAYTKLMGELSTNIRQLDYIPKMSSEEKLQRKKKLEATQEVISQNYKKVMERIALNVDGT